MVDSKQIRQLISIIYGCKGQGLKVQGYNCLTNDEPDSVDSLWGLTEEFLLSNGGHYIMEASGRASIHSADKRRTCRVL
jgi:hypothetical protein